MVTKKRGKAQTGKNNSNDCNLNLSIRRTAVSLAVAAALLIVLWFATRNYLRHAGAGYITESGTYSQINSTTTRSGPVPGRGSFVSGGPVTAQLISESATR